MYIEAVGNEPFDTGDEAHGSIILVVQSTIGDEFDVDVHLLPQLYSSVLRDNLEDDGFISGAQREFTLGITAPGDVAVNTPLHSYYHIPALLQSTSNPDFNFTMGMVDINTICEDMLDDEHWPAIKAELINMWDDEQSTPYEQTYRYLREQQQYCLTGSDEVTAFSNNISSETSLSSKLYGIATHCNPAVFIARIAYFRDQDVDNYVFLRIKAIAY